MHDSNAEAGTHDERALNCGAQQVERSSALGMSQPPSASREGAARSGLSYKQLLPPRGLHEQVTTASLGFRTSLFF